MEWVNIAADTFPFKKSGLCEFNIEDSLLKGLQKLNENQFNSFAVLNLERTLVQGYVSFSMILNYLVEHYQGDTVNFMHPITEFDNGTIFDDIGVNLVSIQGSENLITGFNQMITSRVSMLPVYQESKLVGLLYLNDIVYMIR